MDRERRKLGAYRDVAARGSILALRAGGGLQVKPSTSRAADVIAEGEIGSLAVARLDTPRLDLEMVVEVSAERLATR
jgi:hypothetical protein